MFLVASQPISGTDSVQKLIYRGPAQRRRAGSARARPAPAGRPGCGHFRRRPAPCLSACERGAAGCLRPDEPAAPQPPRRRPPLLPPRRPRPPGLTRPLAAGKLYCCCWCPARLPAAEAARQAGRPMPGSLPERLAHRAWLLRPPPTLLVPQQRRAERVRRRPAPSVLHPLSLLQAGVARAPG